MPRYAAIIGQIIVIIGVTLADIALVPSLPFGLYRLHLIPIALVFVFLFSNIRLAAWWVLGSGLLFEFFSFKGFGVHLVILGLLALLVDFLFSRVMTNRSVYSVTAITVITVTVYDLLMMLYDYLTGILPSISFMSVVVNEFWTVLMNGFVALVVFYLFNLATLRLRPVFLTSRKL